MDKFKFSVLIGEIIDEETVIQLILIYRDRLISYLIFNFCFCISYTLKDIIF